LYWLASSYRHGIAKSKALLLITDNGETFDNGVRSPMALVTSRLQNLRFPELGQGALAAGAAMIAGFVDAYGMITYQTYLSFMSGNTTQTGYKTAEGYFAAAVPSALAIIFFVGGTFSGALLAHSENSKTRRRIFGSVAVLLALIIVFKEISHLPDAAHIAVASFAMGMMNRALSHVGAQQVSLTFVTGTLSRIGVHLALAVKGASLPDAKGGWDSHIRRALILTGVWSGFLSGALMSGAATLYFGAWVLLFPVSILLFAGLVQGDNDPYAGQGKLT
jgi:uncharacterized membrane protein YoaK (UPF0700 family)